MLYVFIRVFFFLGGVKCEIIEVVEIFMYVQVQFVRKYEMKVRSVKIWFLISVDIVRSEKVNVLIESL